MGNIAADMLADGGGDAGDAGLGDAADAFFGGLSGGSVSMSVEVESRPAAPASRW